MDKIIDKLPYEWLAYTLLAIVVLIVSWSISKLLRWTIGRFFKKSEHRLDLDTTTFYFIKNAVSFFVYLLALIFLFYIIPGFKSVGVALFASAGIFAAIAGFAAQSALSNMISGVMIVIFKPFRVDDIITIDGQTGVVEDITLRHTVIRNFENKRLVIPNAHISDQTILNSNITDERTLVHFQIGISYDSDVDLAMKLMREIAADHPLRIDGRSAEDIESGVEELKTRVLGFSDSSVDLRLWVWTKNPDDAYEIKWDLNKKVKEAFDEVGIEIPFPHRTLVMKGELPKAKVKLKDK